MNFAEKIAIAKEAREAGAILRELPRARVAKDYPVVTRAPLTCPRPGCRQYVTRDKDPDYVTCLFHGTVFIAQVPDLDVIPRRGARRSGVVL